MSNNIPIDPWIADFVEQCLSQYLNPSQQTGVEVDDDGTVLHFKVRGLTAQAVVSNWGLGPVGDGAVLMDRGNQINATISPESLTALSLQPQNARLIKDGPKKHRIELLDFQLVLAYSTPVPEVHLHVERFQVDWDNGLIKFVPSRKLQKLERIGRLLEQAYRTVKHAELQGSNGLKSPSRASGSPQVQSRQSNLPQESLSGGNMSPGFKSQLPVHGQEPLEQVSKAALPQLRASATGLLEHLGKAPLLTLHEPFHQTLHQQTRSMQSVFSSDEKQSLSRQTNAQQGPNDHRKSSVLSQPRNDSATEDADVLSTQPLGAIEDIETFETQPTSGISFQARVSSPKVQNVQRSPSPKKRRRGSSSLVSQPDGEEPKSDSPLKKRQCGIDTAHESSLDRTADGNGVKASPLQTRSGPDSTTIHSSSTPQSTPFRETTWAGMTEIATSDVTIENDQEELLENDRMLWIPPNPGQPMPKGHVPPSLLRQWIRIAEQRQHLTGVTKDREASERYFTPTQDTIETCDSDPESEPFSWDASPERNLGPARNRLPDDSPIKQLSLADRHPSQSHNPIKKNTARESPVGSLRDAPATRDTSQPQTGTSAAIQDRFDEPAIQESLGSERNVNVNQSLSSIQGRRERPADCDANLVSKDTSRASTSQVPHDSLTCSEEALSQITNPEPSVQVPKDDSDDESMMDTSVPVALGEALPDPTQSTQTEQDITSSGPSLPGGSGERVQVIETPMTGNCGPQQGNLNQEQPLSSYPAHKSSSQSRVLNTYPFHGSVEKNESSQETSNASGQTEQNEPLRVDVPGTQQQTSSAKSNAHSEHATHNSQSEVVIDSSQRHDDFSQSSPSQFESSLNFTSSHQPLPFQPCQPTQDSTNGASPIGGTQNFAQASPLGQPTPGVINEDHHPSKVSRCSQQEINESSQFSLVTQDAGLLAHLESSKNSKELSEAEKVYERFRNDYPLYTGDFSHFASLCFKLQAFRARGQLQAPSLWDDFIIMHLQRYLPHCQERAALDCPSYEVYFALNFSLPSHTKRSLTVKGIALAASQYGAGFAPLNTHNSDCTVSSGVPSQHPSISLTASLAGRPIDLHTYSFSDAPRGRFPGTNEQGHPDDIMHTTRSLSVEIKQEGSGVDPSDVSRYQPLYIKSSRSTPLPSLESTTDQKLDPSPHNTNEVQSDAEVNILEVEETDTEDVSQHPDDEESCAEDHCHRAASVELGDDSFVSTSAQSRTRVTSNEPLKLEDDDNWFLSFRQRQATYRSQPANDGWYNHSNTPFKSWAIADQNVLSERYRRGRGLIMVNEKGEIRRPVHR